MVEAGEQQLLQSAQAGDRMAFDQLQIRLDPELRRFGHHLLGATDLVDEILQDAFLAMYLKLEEFADAGHVRFFLFRVVRNLCYTQLRRRTRAPTFTLQRREQKAGPAAAQLEEDVIWALMLSDVQAAMAQLPDSQREVLRLLCFHDMGYAEIAEATGVSVGTVKSRIHYGRINLRRLLTPAVREALDALIEGG